MTHDTQTLHTRPARPAPAPNRTRRAMRICLVLAGLGLSSGLAAQVDWAPVGFHVFRAGTQARADEVNANFRWLVERVPPPGSIMAFGGQNAPDGWLLCDNSEYLRADYPDLYAAIGDSWGAANQGEDYFRVPDLRGQFLRGVDPSGTRDRDRAESERVAGSYQADSLQNLYGEVPGVVVNTTNPDFPQPTGAFSYGTYRGATADVAGNAEAIVDVMFDASQSPGVRTSTETRPTNAAVHFIIKY